METSEVNNLKWQTLLSVWVVWAGVGMIHALSRYSDIVKYQLTAPFGVSEVSYYVLSYSLWVPVSLLILRWLTACRFPYSIAKLAGIFFALLVAWLPIYFATDYAISTWQAGGDFAQWQQTFVNTSNSVIFFYVVVYTLTFVACLGRVLSRKTQLTQQRNASLEQQQMASQLLLSEQKMQLMQSQLSPHFLFNCLGAISGLARNGQRDALISAVATVGNLLRFTIANASSKTIMLDEEVAFVKDYINLQTLRFGPRFDCDFNVEIEGQSILCPPFVIQPLLENVFRHAIEVSEQHVDIDATVTQRGDQLEICVQNSIPKIEGNGVSNGTGLNNLRSRLQHLYGEGYSLVVDQQISRYTATVTLPIGGPVAHV